MATKEEDYDFNGGIMIGSMMTEETKDELEDDELFGDEPLLDASDEEVGEAQSSSNEGEDILEEDEDEDDTPRTRISTKARKVPEVSQDVLDEVGDAIGAFDAETANKKQIRNFRLVLQTLSKARYPKKPRTKKKKSKKKKK